MLPNQFIRTLVIPSILRRHVNIIYKVHLVYVIRWLHHYLCLLDKFHLEHAEQLMRSGADGASEQVMTYFILWIVVLEAVVSHEGTLTLGRRTEQHYRFFYF